VFFRSIRGRKKIMVLLKNVFKQMLSSRFTSIKKSVLFVEKHFASLYVKQKSVTMVTPFKLF
jgi:hypothetical protein